MGTRIRLGLLLVAACLVQASRAWAADQVETEAARLQTAFAEGGAKALEAVLPSLRVDRWILTEHLCAAGAEDAAEALARAGPEAAALERLPEYVKWRRANPVSKDERAHWEAFTQLVRERKFKAALAAWDTGRSVGGGLRRARGLRTRVRALRALGRPPPEVIAAHRLAARACKDIGWWSGALSELGFAAGVARREGRSAEIVELADEAIPLATKLSRQKELRGAHMAASAAHRELNDHQAALRHAEAGWKASATPAEERQALRILVLLEVMTNRRHALRRHLPRMRELGEQIGTPLDLARIDIQIASLEATLGNLNAALVRIQDVLAYMREHGSAAERRGAHLHAAKIWLQIRDGPRCREHIRLAREAGRGLGYDESYLHVLEGWAHWIEENPAEAEKSFRLAVPLMAKATVERRVSLHTALATVLAAQGKAAPAAAEITAARALVDASPDVAAGNRTELALAESVVHQAAGDHRAALAAAQAARAHRIPGLFRPLDAVVEVRVAISWMGLEKPEQALSCVRRATAVLVERSAGLPEEVGARHRAEMALSFEVGIDAAGLSDDPAALFSLAEQARAVALRTQLDAGEIASRAVDPALLQSELDLVEDEAGAVDSYRSAVATGENAKIKAAYEALGEVREELERHRERMRARHAVAGQMLNPAIDDLEGSRKALAGSEALVVFAVGGWNYWALVVTPKAVRIANLGTVEEIAALTAAVAVEDPSLPAEAATASLSKALVQPLELPADVRRIRLLPAGRLAWIPFALLWPEKELVMLPSVTVGRMLAGRRTTPGEEVLAVAGSDASLGAPLAHAEIEARAVGDVVLTGEGATEGGMLKAMGTRKHWRAVHLACHGLIDPRHPLRSALSLLPSEGRDGLWTVSEILGTRLDADLVTLSSCSSARGKLFDQEGVLSFAHALFVSGASSVLTSLWDVDDEATAELMKRFYAAWEPGTHPAAALRDAQASMRKETRWKHPAFWAGWQVWGAP